MNKKEEKYLFIGGCGRSGTTLLQAMLNAHKEVYGGPEFGYLPLLCQTKNKIESSINPKNKLDVYLNIDKLNRKFEYLIKELISGPAKEKEAKVISEKSPHNVNVFKDLSIIFPDAKFIFVIRDPRGIYASSKQIKERAKNDSSIKPPDYAINLNKSVKYIEDTWSIGFDFVVKNPSKSIIVYYEDLVLNPELITKEICEFIELDWDSGMLNHSKNMDKIIGDNEKSIWGGADLYHRSVHTDSINKWKSLLTSSESLIIEKRLKKFEIIRNRYFSSDKSKKSMVSLTFILFLYRKNYYNLKQRLIKILKSL